MYVELVKCCYGDRGNSRFILGVSKEVFGRGSSSFVKYSEEVFILCENSKEVQVHLLCRFVCASTVYIFSLIHEREEEDNWLGFNECGYLFGLERMSISVYGC
ncbi:hypothetical protein LR48_Vigan01g276300 [Vigna angularis]|uniref:Uncharacterized protein n=1 Tax=Phaseolus angularis TaxID=3914 RepID=A0A0L9TRY6_PHAAN|nr:hypothetical protein LR48_Vigan01g276300 [Vigna angularis]